MGAAERFHLEGKDWFTEPEAAAYCGVCVSTLREGYKALGIEPRRFLGKKLYSRLELNDAIRNSPAWQTSSSAENHGSSVGARVAVNTDVLSARLQPEDAGEQGWEFQRLRGTLAARLGYTSVEMVDEHGTTWLCLPGCTVEVLSRADA